MKFADAFKKFKFLANGKHSEIQFKITVYSDGQEFPKCCLYVQGFGFTDDLPTWEEAFKQMEKKLIGIEQDPPNPLEYAPEGNEAEGRNN